ncbi:hypothetical protein [Streptomyces scabiei]|uniref:hypothetical protein n=1 Tax=Streptomyces scabiei TaxID=1930 RepID=UPI000A71D412|nr:hypothetical protein [Streptomyces scabiei]
MPYAASPARGAGSRSTNCAPCSCADDDGSAEGSGDGGSTGFDGSGSGWGSATVGGGVGSPFVGSGCSGRSPFPSSVPPFGGVAFPDGSAAPEADGAAEADLDAEGPGEAEPRRFPCPDWYPVPPPPVTAEPPSGFSPPRCPADGDGPGFRPSSPTLIQPAAAATAMTVAARRTDTFKARTAATSEGAKRGVPLPNSRRPQEDTRRPTPPRVPHFTALDRSGTPQAARGTARPAPA